MEANATYVNCPGDAWFELEDAMDVNVNAIAQTDSAILLVGAPGRAERLARQIHWASGWRHGPFRVVDCSAPSGEVRALLAAFCGYEDWGCLSPSQPVPRLKQDGTIFLREVGRLNGGAQRLLGDWLAAENAPAPGRPRTLRARIMASTSKDLWSRIAEGTFDQQLYQHISAARVTV